MAMTIAQALKELKIIDDKINRRIDELKGIAATLSINTPIYGPDQDNKVKKLTQSVVDLTERKHDLKIAIQAANIRTIVEYGGKKYSLAKILLLKQGGMAHLKNLVSALKTDYIEEQAENLQRTRQEGQAPVTVIYHFDLEWREKIRDWTGNTMSALDFLIEEANMKTELPGVEVPKEEPASALLQ